MSEAKLRADYAILLSQFDELDALAADDATLATRKELVSGWSVGQHLDHLATTDKFVVMGMMKSLYQPEKLPGEPNFAAKVVLFTGWMPRGKGQAPDMTMPKSKDGAAIRANLKQARGNLASLEPKLGELAKCEGRIQHPRLGVFAPGHWMRFLGVHHDHHIKIVSDILRSR